MNVIVTAGPTREFIDPVRFISNRSTGKMGYAIAGEAMGRGHHVRLISGPVALAAPIGVDVVGVVTAAEMLTAVESHLEWCDALVMAAAVADWRPRRISAQKLKKRVQPSSLELEPTVDILSAIAPRKQTRVFVGFAAETEGLLEEAARKLKAKGLDMIVANDVSRADAGFETDTNVVVLVTPNGNAESLPLMSKTAVAGRIMDWIERHMARQVLSPGYRRGVSAS